MSAAVVENKKEATPEAKTTETVEQPSQTKKQPVLTPAPIPTTSPWKAVETEIPVTVIDLDPVNGNNKSQPMVKHNSANTKWVPINASIVISGSKKNNHFNNNNNNNNSKGHNKGNNKRNNNNRSNSERKSNNTKKPHSPKNDSNIKSDDTTNNISSSNSDNDQKSDEQSQNRRQHNQRKQYSNNSQKKHYNNKFHNNRSHRFNNRSNRFIPNNNNQQQFNQYYNMQPIMLSVNNIARQLEYYFSAENLEKDAYLRNQLTNEGYSPLSLISTFYRVVNMSYGGDANLIMAALREIVINPNATIEVAEGTVTATTTPEETETTEEKLPKTQPNPILSKYFIRSKQWQSWLPESPKEANFTIEKTLTGDALDEFIIPVMPPQQQQTEVASDEKVETAPATEEKQTIEEEN